MEDGITLEIIPGTVDLVSWSKTIFFFGDSFANLNEGQVGILSEIITNKGFTHPGDSEEDPEPMILWVKPNMKRCTPLQSGRYERSHLDQQAYNTWIPSAPMKTKIALSRTSNEQLKFYWQNRKDIAREWKEDGLRIEDKPSFITQVWDEYKLRYRHKNLNNIPIKLSLPHELFKLAPELKKRIGNIIRKYSGWPPHIVEWHIKNIRISESNSKGIGEILHNVNMPWKPENRCRCGDIYKNLRKAGSKWEPPKCNGHIFFIGREYEGPHRDLLNMCNKNIPNNSRRDIWNILNTCLKQVNFPVPENAKKNILKEFTMPSLLKNMLSGIEPRSIGNGVDDYTNFPTQGTGCA